MMLFSIGTGLEGVGVAGLDPDCLRAGMLASGSSGLKQDRVGVSIDLQAPNVALLYKNKREKRGSARAVPVAAPMLKSASF